MTPEEYERVEMPEGIKDKLYHQFKSNAPVDTNHLYTVARSLDQALIAIKETLMRAESGTDINSPLSAADGICLATRGFIRQNSSYFTNEDVLNVMIETIDVLREELAMTTYGWNEFHPLDGE